MKTLPLVIGLLLLLTILTYTRLERHTADALSANALIGHSGVQRAAFNSEQRIKFEEAAPSRSSAKPPRPSKIEDKEENESEPKQNRWRWKSYDTLLDFTRVLYRQPEKIVKGTLDEYEVTARLMRLLYTGQPCFSPGVEYRLLDCLALKAAQGAPLTKADQVSSILLDDQELQAIFYLMLKGAEGYPSLLDFITVEPVSSESQKINLFHAPQPVLAALFDDPELATELVVRRGDLIRDFEGRQLSMESSERQQFFVKSAHQVLSVHHQDLSRYTHLVEMTLIPQNSKYRYITLSVTDPASGMTLKRRIRLAIH